MTARINATTDTTAPEATKPVLAQLKQAIGMIPNVYATMGHSPGSLVSALAWGEAIGKGTLSKREIEQLNLHVSELNGCAYCVSAHSALGGRVGLKPEEVIAARDGVGSTERENALLAFARRVVRTGGARAGTDLARLREAGVSDAEVIDVLAVVALNAFRNSVSIVSETEIDFPKAPRLPSP
ncbi:MAG: carboxymuconolactone decarboxylase family protein [Sandaracinaceae bacterium]|nr:carboxymuconolactone decarboxylase family protein [Sandaracinaceae bacterium]